VTEIKAPTELPGGAPRRSRRSDPEAGRRGPQTPWSTLCGRSNLRSCAPGGGGCPGDKQLKPTFLQKKLTLTPELVNGYGCARYMDGGLSEAPAATQTASAEGQRSGRPTPCATLRGGIESSEEAGSIVLRGNATGFCKSWSRGPRVERLEAKLERRRLPWWRRWFGG